MQRLLCFLLLNMHCAFGASQFKVYSESVYSSENNVFSTMERVRYEAYTKGAFSFQPEVGNELATTPSGSIASHSHIHLGFNLKIQFSIFQFYNQLKWMQFYKNSSESKGIDNRQLLIVNKQFDYMLSDFDKLFLELYSETINIHIPEFNVIHSGFVRMGYRKVNIFSFDIFVDSAWSRDLQKHSYYNKFEVRPSLRIGYLRQSLSIYLSTAYAFNFYFDPKVINNSGIHTLMTIAWNH